MDRDQKKAAELRQVICLYYISIFFWFLGAPRGAKGKRGGHG